MWSFARTPGNCFAMPRSSRTGVSSMRGDSMQANREGGLRAGTRLRCLQRLADRGRNLDLPRDDPPLEDGDLRHHPLFQRALQPRADLAERDAVVLQVEHGVRAALEMAGLRLLDRVEHSDIHPFDG